MEMHAKLVAAMCKASRSWSDKSATSLTRKWRRGLFGSPLKARRCSFGEVGGEASPTDAAAEITPASMAMYGSHEFRLMRTPVRFALGDQ